MDLYIKRLIHLIGRPLVALSYIYIGAWMHEKIKEKQTPWLIISLLLISNIIMGYINGRVDLFTMKLNNILLYYLAAITGSIGIILFFKRISTIKIFEFLGKNSLIIMITHQKFPFITISKQLLEKLNFPVEIITIITFLIVMMIEILLIYLINKYAKVLIKYKPKQERSIE